LITPNRNHRQHVIEPGHRVMQSAGETGGTFSLDVSVCRYRPEQRHKHEQGLFGYERWHVYPPANISTVR
jgi:hypothetical protein